MKKLFIFIICIVMLFSLSACRNNNQIISDISVNSTPEISSEITNIVSDTSSEDTVSETAQEISSTTESVNSTTAPVSSVTVPSTNNVSSTVDETVSSSIEDAKDKIENITDSIVPDITPAVPDITPSSSNNTDTSSEEEITPNIPAEDLFKFGTTTENTYENKFWGVGCTLDSDWVLLSEAEIKEYNGISLEATPEQIDEHISNSFLLIDMVATKESGDAVIMALTMSDLGTGSFAELDMEEFMNSQVESTRENMIQSGFECTIVERNDLTIDNKPFYAISASGELEGVYTYQTVLCLKTDYYMSLIQITAPTEAELAATLNSFYVPQ